MKERKLTGELPVMAIGESFVGEGAEAAQTAWATGPATPCQGHTPFLAVVRPGLSASAQPGNPHYSAPSVVRSPATGG